MTDEQAWNDLARFAEAMKRGATVVMNCGAHFPSQGTDPSRVCEASIIAFRGIREIIEPPQKKVRPLNAEEWRDVAGCILIPYRLPEYLQFVTVRYDEIEARKFADNRATCHPPGYPGDIRKLYVEENA